MKLSHGVVMENVLQQINELEPELQEIAVERDSATGEESYRVLRREDLELLDGLFQSHFPNIYKVKTLANLSKACPEFSEYICYLNHHLRDNRVIPDQIAPSFWVNLCDPWQEPRPSRLAVEEVNPYFPRCVWAWLSCSNALGVYRSWLFLIAWPTMRRVRDANDYQREPFDCQRTPLIVHGACTARQGTWPDETYCDDVTPVQGPPIVSCGQPHAQDVDYLGHIEHTQAEMLMEIRNHRARAIDPSSNGRLTVGEQEWLWTAVYEPFCGAQEFFLDRKPKKPALECKYTNPRRDENPNTKEHDPNSIRRQSFKFGYDGNLHLRYSAYSRGATSHDEHGENIIAGSMHPDWARENDAARADTLTLIEGLGGNDEDQERFIDAIDEHERFIASGEDLRRFFSPPREAHEIFADALDWDHISEQIDGNTLPFVGVWRFLQERLISCSYTPSIDANNGAQANRFKTMAGQANFLASMPTQRGEGGTFEKRGYQTIFGEIRAQSCKDAWMVTVLEFTWMAWFSLWVFGSGKGVHMAQYEHETPLSRFLLFARLFSTRDVTMGRAKFTLELFEHVHPKIDRGIDKKDRNDLTITKSSYLEKYLVPHLSGDVKEDGILSACALAVYALYYDLPGEDDDKTLWQRFMDQDPENESIKRMTVDAAEELDVTEFNWADIHHRMKVASFFWLSHADFILDFKPPKTKAKPLRKFLGDKLPESITSESHANA